MLKRGVLAVLVILVLPLFVFAEGTCVETDYGPNFYRLGTTGFRISGQGTLTGAFTDVCSGEMLSEYYCEKNEIEIITYTCDDGCKDGACIQKAMGEATLEEATAAGQHMGKITTPEDVQPEPVPAPTPIPPPKKEEPMGKINLTQSQIETLARIIENVFDESFIEVLEALTNANKAGMIENIIEFYKDKPEAKIFLIQLQAEAPKLYVTLTKLKVDITLDEPTHTDVIDFSSEDKTEVVNNSYAYLDFSELGESDSDMKQATRAGLGALVVIIVALLMVFSVFKKRVMIFLRLDYPDYLK
ncbi:hypothetical protein HN419_01460 [Candidatus Woesearchaeota archaeon]|jgi:hypothetical protein|nr:hypothetical protein [Candidatus Woesearchaeota archaeon]MBT3537336.1 hypothetical protein [Candidatus Woesearchaeota archaeon]MBT4697395.1 hypothetical protein [Candidatus Woesearchaeota archaeon]MBT4716698.1 hypothetical protein [Candidatus Woesearchaeota archaeon]MBT7106354.1 hypothetical protein [Candidatus Woesearchaeota archaeon]